MNLYTWMEVQEQTFPDGEREEWITTLQKLLYANDYVYRKMLHFQSRWYGTGSQDEFHGELRGYIVDAFEHSVIYDFHAGKVPQFKRCALEILYTRIERWRQLALCFGLAQAPDGFTVYRATDWRDAVAEVLRAWESELDSVRVPHAGLSSWSLLEGDKRRGARTHLEKHRNGVLAVADVPIEDTFMDVLVDDGYFARHGMRECEIVIGTGDAGLDIVAYPKRCVVRVEGTDYRYHDRANALQHARRAGLLPRR